MSTLIVIVYPDELQAEQVRLDFIKMQKEYLVSLDDAVIAVKKPDGKVKLHQMYNLTLGGAVSGGLWGTLIGLIFLNPLLGLVMGAGAGAVAQRRGHQRRLHEAARLHPHPRLLGALRAGGFRHHRQGARRARGHGRQDYPDLPLHAGPGKAPEGP